MEEGGGYGDYEITIVYDDGFMDWKNVVRLR